MEPEPTRTCATLRRSRRSPTIWSSPGCGMERFVFVQPSAYGRDNACMLDAVMTIASSAHKDRDTRPGRDALRYPLTDPRQLGDSPTTRSAR
jgi:hypothetical protein